MTNSEPNNYLSIDIGGTNTKVAIINSNGKFLEQFDFPTDQEANFDHFIEKLNQLWINKNKNYNLKAMAVGSPNYNRNNGQIEQAPNLPWKNAPLLSALKTKITPNVIVEKDVAMASFGEYYFGQKKMFSELLIITIGTGIGTGIITAGNILKTNNGLGCEGGHLVVGNLGRLCGCGHFDHLEAYSSVSALRKRASEIFNQNTTFTTLREKFLAHDKVAIEIISESAHYLGLGIASMTSLLGSDKVILSGGGVSLGDEYLKLVRSSYQKHAFNKAAEILIEFSTLPINHAALMGGVGMLLTLK